jgi:hypothetical protein
MVKIGKDNTESNNVHRKEKAADAIDTSIEKITDAVINFALQILLRSVLVTNFKNQPKNNVDQFSLFSGIV